MFFCLLFVFGDFMSVYTCLYYRVFILFLEYDIGKVIQNLQMDPCRGEHGSEHAGL